MLPTYSAGKPGDARSTAPVYSTVSGDVTWDTMSFISELKRRKVLRVAAIYIVSAWLSLQVADVLFPGWGVPDTAIRFVVYAAAAGFPLALLFAWMFDITPHGIRRTPRSDTHEATTLASRDYGLLVFLVLLFVAITWNFAHRVALTRSGIPEASIPVRVPNARLLAILPFHDESLETEDAAFLANGVHRDLMTNVMKIASLGVIAPGSVEQYRDTRKPPSVIGRELAVSHILEGAVQRAGARVRVTLQLVKADSELSIWAESYDRTLTADNLFEIQADIAEKVAIALQAEMTPAEKSRVQNPATEIFAAYEALARGYEAYDENNAVAIEEALHWFRRALEVEPDFAHAHQAIGRLYAYTSLFGALPPEEAFELAENSLRRAIELDPAIGPAYAWLAVIVRNRDGEFAKALDLLDTALANEPGNARIMHIKALTLRLLGRLEEAAPLYKRAQRLDPLSLTVTESYGSFLRDFGRFEDAEQQYRRALALDPDFPSTWWGLGTLYWTKGQPAQALEWFDGAIDRLPYSDDFRAWLSLAQLELGQAGLAEESAQQSLVALRGRKSTSVQYVLYLAAVARGDDFTRWPDERTMLGHIWLGGAMQLPGQTLMQSQFAGALTEIEARVPGLENADEALDFRNFREAVDAAIALARLGEKERSTQLLDRVDAFIATQHRIGFRGYWVEDARVAALRGDSDGAIVALETAVAEGWRNLWWFYFEHDPALDTVRADARFQALHSVVAAEMRAESAKP